jgi:transcription initiation factor IIF auxiliary subunit
MTIQQSESYIDDNWWNWAVWVEGTPEELDQLEYVEWKLHPTFADPVRRVTNRSTNFKLETGGWGVFTIYATAQRKDGKGEKLHHYLRLTYPDGGPAPA